MELRSIEDWTLLKEFKSVPNVVDVSDFGGTVREYQVRVDPNKLVSYGLSIGQVEQQLASNNVNAGGSFVEAGLQQMNVRTLGLFSNVQDIEQTVLKTQTGTALRVKDIAEVAQGPKIRLGHMARAIHRADGRIVDEDDVIQGVVLLRKGADAGPTLDAIHAKVKELNNEHPASGREDRSHAGPQRSPSLHLAHGDAQPGGRDDPGDHHPFPLSLQCTCRSHRRLHNSVLFALRFHMARFEQDSRESSLAWRTGFRNGRGRRSGHGRKHRSPHEPRKRSNGSKTAMERIRDAAHEVQRPVFYAIAIIITAYMPIFTLQRVEGRLFRPMAWTVAFALLGALTFSILVAPVLCGMLFRRGVRERHNPVMTFLPTVIATVCAGRSNTAG